MGIDWKKWLANVAPAIAGSLGGPFGPVASAVLKKALGLKEDAKDSDIADAVVAVTSPDQLAELRKIDNEFRARMAQVGIDLEKIDAEDRANARARQVSLKDHTPTVLAFASIAGFYGAFMFVCTHVVPDGSRDVVMAQLGSMATLAATVMTFYFGSSRSSRTKDETINTVVNK